MVGLQGGSPEPVPATYILLARHGVELGTWAPLSLRSCPVALLSRSRLFILPRHSLRLLLSKSDLVAPTSIRTAIHST